MEGNMTVRLTVVVCFVFFCFLYLPVFLRHVTLLQLETEGCDCIVSECIEDWYKWHKKLYVKGKFVMCVIVTQLRCWISSA